MASNNRSKKNAGMFSQWGTERWAGMLVLLALGMLIAIRMGFRGVNVLGANVSVR